MINLNLDKVKQNIQRTFGKWPGKAVIIEERQGVENIKFDYWRLEETKEEDGNTTVVIRLRKSFKVMNIGFKHIRRWTSFNKFNKIQYSDGLILYSERPGKYEVVTIKRGTLEPIDEVYDRREFTQNNEAIENRYKDPPENNTLALILMVGAIIFAGIVVYVMVGDKIGAALEAAKIIGESNAKMLVKMDEMITKITQAIELLRK